MKIIKKIKEKFSKVEKAEIQTIKTIRTLAELDEELSKLNELNEISTDALKEGFKTFQMEFDLTEMPKNPYSTEYKNWWLEYFKFLYGREYNSNDEELVISPETQIPYPYCTESCTIVADQMECWAKIIRIMNLKKGASVLECGFGFGNIVLSLAQMGFDITGLDININFKKLVNKLAQYSNVTLDLRLGDFLSVKDINKKFDVILFVACFHHCLDHYELLNILKTKLKEGGRIIFAMEPIYNQAYPWGIRNDAETLFQVRQKGWLELGFSKDYFEDLLYKAGYDFELMPDNIYVAKETIKK